MAGPGGPAPPAPLEAVPLGSAPKEGGVRRLSAAEGPVSCRVDDAVRLLGVPRRATDSGEELLPPGQAVLLVAYLAIRAEWVARDELTALLWPDAEPKRGRHNLSQLLYAVRRSRWGHDVEGEPTRVRWGVACDVAAFRRAAAEGDWPRATELYGGELLEGVASGGTARLDAWLRAEREDLRESWREALQRHAESHAREGRWRESARLLRRLLASDDLLEDAVQALMRSEAMAGRRDAALQAYDAFRGRLHDELGLAPLDATVQLAADVRSGAIAAPSQVPRGTRVAPVVAPTTSPTDAGTVDADGAEPRGADPEARDVRPGPVRNLAPDATPFVGRGLELAELHALAASDAHRLVTILGPGGSGKSRVARQLARERAGHHEDGAVWVPLTTATSEIEAAAAIARALDVRVDADAEALAGVLAEADLLLVLDDAEQVADLPGLVVALLDACPRLRVVAASRTALDVPGEAVMRLDGLAVPPRNDARDAEAYDAVGLLLRSAHRVRPDFQPRDAERTAAVALTRLVEGSPLAIELAAGWLRVLEPSELLREIERDLDVLRGLGDEMPSRHVSLRAVFESSWSLLGENERESARRLAVFHGGCTRDTAAAVADVPLGTLLALTNRSMLYRDDRTRFKGHAMVGRFAREKLSERPDTLRKLTRRHAAYFLALAEDADRRLDTQEQAAALASLDAESGNLTAALRRAVGEGRGDVALALTAALGRWWRWRGRAREGLAWIARVRALDDADEPSTPRVRSLLAEGLLWEKTGAYDRADGVFERGLALAMQLGDAALVAAARTDQATVAWRRGDLAAASSLLGQAAARYRELGRDAALAGTLNNLGNVARDAGALADAHARYDEALRLAERLDHVWEVANVRNNIAIAHAYAGDLEAARGEFERALALQRSIDDLPGVSKSLTNLGNVHLDTGRPGRARDLYGEALELCEQIDDREGSAHLYVNLGILAQRGGAFDDAHELYGRALRIRRELGTRALAAQSVACFLDLAVARGAYERAVVLAGAVRTLCASVGVPLTGPQQRTYDAALEAARAAVPSGRAIDLEARGAAFAEREAVAFALAERVAAG